MQLVCVVKSLRTRWSTGVEHINRFVTKSQNKSSAQNFVFVANYSLIPLDSYNRKPKTELLESAFIFWKNKV